MYTLVKALVHDRLVRNKWVELSDLTQLLNTPVEQVNGLFGPIQLILTHNTEPTKLLRYDFTNKRREFKAGSINPVLSAWLTEVASFNLSSLPFTGSVIGKAFYSDILEAGFGITTAIPGGMPNDRHADEVREDVLITVPKTLTPDLLQDNCLFTVAGYLHRPYATVNGVYLRGGGTTLNRSNQNTCGVISFSTLGGIKTHGITEDMLSALPDPEARTRKLTQPVFVKVPDYDPKKQTVMLSLMGVLLPLGKTFREVGDGIFEINLARYNYMMAWMRAERIMGFKDIKLKIEQNKHKPTQLSMFDVAGYEFVKGILTCSQTFLIVINNPSIYCDKVQLETTQNSMAFMHSDIVDAPVVDSQGVLMDYLLTHELDQWIVDVAASDLDNRRVNTTPHLLLDAVDSLNNHLVQKVRNTAYILNIVGQRF